MSNFVCLRQCVQDKMQVSQNFTDKLLSLKLPRSLSEIYISWKLRGSEVHRRYIFSVKFRLVALKCLAVIRHCSS